MSFSGPGANLRSRKWHNVSNLNIAKMRILSWILHYANVIESLKKKILKKSHNNQFIIFIF